MKSLKRNIAFILALSVCFSWETAVCGRYSENAVVAFAEEEKVSGDWSYIVYDKIEGICDTPCVELTGYNPVLSYDSVDIPAEINKYPVVSISGEIFKERKCSYIYIPSSIKRFGEGFEESVVKADSVVIDYKFNFVNHRVGESDSLSTEEHIMNGMELTYIYNEEEKEEEKKEENIEIPATVAGIPVTALGDWVFSENKKIKSVKIPDTVRYFGTYVFSKSSLQSVNIPESLKVIPSNTFAECKNLKSVTFHDNLLVANNAFKGTDITVPENVYLSESTVFVNDSYGIINKKSGYFDMSVTYNKDTNAYEAEAMSYDADSVSGTNAEVVIPDYFLDIPITKVNEHFWDKCNATGIELSAVTFPSGVTEIWNLGLKNPEALKSVNIKGQNVSIYSGAFRGSGIEEIVLNGSCTLQSDAFAECRNLKRVEFTGKSPTVKTGNNAFRKCTALEKIVFPDNVDLEMNIDSLGYCTSLKELVLNGKIKVNSNACRGCDSLEKITLSGDVEVFLNSFANNYALTDIIIDTEKIIEGSAFNGCDSLTNINSVPVFDTETKSFRPETADFVMKNFNGADNVGFINLYIQAETDKFIDQYIDDSMNDMQKIKTVHDWVCSNVIYDYETTRQPKNHNDASVFMNDSSVCEGYARCYNIILNAAGIETYYVMSENHTWNIVKIGGHYFHTDTTWDDGEEISHGWFLKSDDEMKAETSSHGSWKLNMPSPLHSFQGEELPVCEYSMGDMNTDGEVNIADLVAMNKYIVGKSSINGNDIVLSDLNYDGVTDVFDMVCMRKIVAGIK